MDEVPIVWEIRFLNGKKVLGSSENNEFCVAFHR